MSMIAKDNSNEERSVRCDSIGTLLVTPTGVMSLTVSIVPSTSIIAYDTNSTVLSSVTTTLLSYTNTTGGLVLVDGFCATGDNAAEFYMLIDGTKRMVRRSSEQQRNVDFFLPTALRLENNSYIDIQVTHYDTVSAQFQCSLFGHRS